MFACQMILYRAIYVNFIEFEPANLFGLIKNIFLFEQMTQQLLQYLVLYRFMAEFTMI